MELQFQQREILSEASSQGCGQRHRCPCRQPASVSQNLQGQEVVDEVEDLPPVEGVCMTFTVGFVGVFGSLVVIAVVAE